MNCQEILMNVQEIIYCIIWNYIFIIAYLLKTHSSLNHRTSLEKNRRTTMINQLKISLKQFDENLRGDTASKK